MTTVDMLSIGDCIENVSTWNPLKSKNAVNFSYIDLSSLDRNKKIIDPTQVTVISSSDAPSRAREIVKTGDVLVATVRPNLNGVATITEDYNGSTASIGYCVLRPNQKIIDSKYLLCWVRTEKFVAKMMSMATGASYPAVSDKIIKNSTLPLPLPPLEEQKRIAAIPEKPMPSVANASRPSTSPMNFCAPSFSICLGIQWRIRSTGNL